MKKGLIGKKIGMTQIFDEAGNVIPDRKSVVEGKRVDLGGRRIMKKKKKERKR